MLNASNDAWDIIGQFIECSLHDLRFVYPFVSRSFAERASKLWTKHGEQRVLEQKVNFLNMGWINKHAHAMRKMQAHERMPWISKFPRCTSLGITIWEDVPSEEQIPPSELFPNLRELSVLDVNSLSIFQPQFTKLVCLHLHGTFGSDNLKYLENLPNLLSLTLFNCPRVISIAKLATCTQLRFLQLKKCENLASLSGVQQITSLCITSCPILKYTSLLDIGHVTLLHWQMAYTWSKLTHSPAYPLANRFANVFVVEASVWTNQRKLTLGDSITPHL